MKKPRTIPCDYCGVRLDHLPEVCPECGEEIASRIDPEMKNRLDEYERGSFMLEVILVVFICGSTLILLVIEGSAWAGLCKDPKGLYRGSLVFSVEMQYLFCALGAALVALNLKRISTRLAKALFIYLTVIAVLNSMFLAALLFW